MDLLVIARKFWRYKLLTLPVVLLTLFGAAYVIAVKEPVYETSSSYIMINPPLPPTEEDIARNPALGRINADNPYARFSDETVIVDVLASSMANTSTEETLVKKGADPRYKVSSASALGFSSPILKITAQGGSPEVAVKSAELVGKGVTQELDRMQKAEGVDPTYWIKSKQVEAPDGAQLRASGQLRMLVGVLAFGAVLLFVVVSVADAVSTLRRERMGHPAPAGLAGNDGALPPYDGQARGLPALEDEDWSEFDEEESAGSDQLITLFPDREPGATGSTSTPPTRLRPYRRKQLGSGG
jgi:capsular polysaccharide biosynthesis protein